MSGRGLTPEPLTGAVEAVHSFSQSASRRRETRHEETEKGGGALSRQSLSSLISSYPWWPPSSLLTPQEDGLPIAFYKQRNYSLSSSD